MSASVQEVLHAFDATLPLSKARTIPSAWYFDPEIYALECRKVFGNTWQYVGRAEQVRDPGSFLTIEIAGEPILAVRDEKGALRAFHNACRHRAAQVMNEPCGHATKLRCRYHGWTYDLAGRLRGTPEFDGVEDFRKEEHKACQQWRSTHSAHSCSCTKGRRNRRWPSFWRRFPKKC
jgi:choline monooxygenase